MGHFRALPGASRAAGATLNSLGAPHTAVSLYIRLYSSIHAIQPYSARSSSQPQSVRYSTYSTIQLIQRVYSIQPYSLYTIHPHRLPLCPRRGRRLPCSGPAHRTAHTATTSSIHMVPKSGVRSVRFPAAPPPRDRHRRGVYQLPATSY